MAAFKFALLFALAFFACQGEAKQVHPLLPKADGGLDLPQIIRQVIQIVEIIVAKVKEGVDEVDPTLQDLVALLPPNAGADVSSLITSLKNILTNLDEDISGVIDVIDNALNQLQNVQSCIDPQSDALKQILDTALEGIDQVIRDQIAANQDDVNEALNNVDSDVADLLKLIYDNIAAALVCMTPGNADSCSCLSTLGTNLSNGVVGWLGTVVLHGTFDIDLLRTIIPAIITDATPYINDGVAAAGPLIDNVCACVAGL